MRLPQHLGNDVAKVQVQEKERVRLFSLSSFFKLLKFEYSKGLVAFCPTPLCSTLYVCSGKVSLSDSCSTRCSNFGQVMFVRCILSDCTLYWHITLVCSTLAPQMFEFRTSYVLRLFFDRLHFVLPFTGT
jgi:hypothetical protein